MFDRKHSCLLIIDMQPDFLPGGALAVRGGDSIIEPVRQLLESSVFPLAVATQDWHPAGHISFASSHPGRSVLDTIELYGREQVLWPDHCVIGSRGAALHPQLPWNDVRAIIRKGTDPEVDSYSGFRNNWDKNGARPPTGLAGYLRELAVTDICLCGLARDFCVRWSAEDAAASGFKTAVLWDLTRAVDPSSDDAVREALERRGVRVSESADL
jgi:nicotinamidase/pyrazinamidase